MATTTKVHAPLTIPVNSSDFHPEKNGQTSHFDNRDDMDNLAIEHTVVSRCLAEFVATLLFVFIGVTQTLSAAGQDGVLHSAFVHGFTLLFLVVAFGRISGAHINPAVTFGIGCVGKISPITAVCYVISQLSGGFIGALLTRAAVSGSTAGNIGATLVSPSYHWYNALFVEIMATAILVLVVLLTAVDNEKHMFASVAIGFAVVADVLAFGAISGASMNPARSFGPNVVGSLFVDASLLPNTFWSYHFIYYVGPIVGALLAAVIYKIFFASDERLVA